MNEKKYLSYLKQYHQWLVAHQENYYKLTLMIRIIIYNFANKTGYSNEHIRDIRQSALPSRE